MKASAFEFKFRFPIIVAICVIGFVAPWDFWLHWDTIRTWQWLAARISRLGWLGFSGATDAVLVAGIVLAFAAALLRTWGAATGLRNRNPVDVGTFLNVLAISLLTLPSGAVFTIVVVALFLWRLRGVEVQAPEARLRWWQAVVGEIYPWGAAVSFAALGWRYNALPIIQGVIVSLGLSVVVRAFLPKS